VVLLPLTKIEFIMEKRSFKEATFQATKCLKNKLARAEGTVKYYNYHWRKINRFMKFKDLALIDSDICRDYLLQKFGDRDYSALVKGEKDTFRTVTTLIEFLESGTIQARKEVIDFEGSIGQIMINYLSFKSSQRLAKHTIEEYEQHLSRFLRFLKEIHVESIIAVNQAHILNYIKSINPKTISLAHIALRTLRDFFRYLYNHRFLEADLSYMMPRDNYKKQAKIPSIYTVDEIEALIATPDRGSAVGKRDYTIILLAARLGMRASDIANLKFENISWEQNKINLTQFKTRQILELPLLAEVGNAIVDYLKYGRPKSDEPFLFLCARSPFNSIHTPVVTKVVENMFIKTGINTKDRKHGPHALRHSLSGLLLERQPILPVICEVLGHVNTESTRFYLRIDLTSLRQCVLEVPNVTPIFYTQKGGSFYE
jgi:site-specific recombinase XerD